MSNSNLDLRTLTLFERKEYEELKFRYSLEAKKLREKRIILGFLIVSFVATLAYTGVFN